MRKVYILLILGFNSLISCEHFENIKIQNNSSSVIYFDKNCYGLDSIQEIKLFEPDSKDLNADEYSNLYRRIEPNQFKYISYVTGYRNPKDELHKSLNEECKDSLLKIYIFKVKTIIENPWDSIVKYKMYDTILSYSANELRKMNYEIIYN